MNSQKSDGVRLDGPGGLGRHHDVPRILQSVDQFRRAMRDAVILREGAVTVHRADKSELTLPLFPE